MSKKIWILNNYAGAPKYGMVFRHYYLAKEFVAKGYEVDIFSSRHSHLFHVKKPNKKKENISGVTFHWLRTTPYRNSKTISRILNMVSYSIIILIKCLFEKKPDVIIASSPSPFAALVGLILSKLRRVPFVYEIRDLWPLSIIELGGIAQKHPLVICFTYIESLCAKHCDVLASVLPQAEKYFSSRYLIDTSKKFLYVPNAIDINENFVQSSRADIKSYFNERRNRKIICYMGTLGIANKMEDFVELARRFSSNKDLSFLIMGKGPSLSRLKKQAEKLQNVTFLNAVPKDEVQSILSNVDFTFLNWHSTELYKFGISANKMFDYLYSGKPCLMGFDYEHDSITQSMSGEVVKSNCIDSLELGLKKLLSLSEEDYKIMSERAKKYVIDNHTYSEVSKKYLSKISMLL